MASGAGTISRPARLTRIAPSRGARASAESSVTANWGVDALLVVLLVAVTAALHPVHYSLDHPYWLDEAWVALAAKSPMSMFVRVSSSTPVGWLFLVRLFPDGGEAGRLVTLAFSLAAVVAAYVLARSLPWSSRRLARTAAVVTAAAVTLTPISMLRNDLKQYTADAFCALVVLAFAQRAEVARDRRRHLELAAVALVALPFSTASAFVALAAFASLFVVALASRAREWLGHVVLGAAVFGALGVAWFAAVIVPNDIPSLQAFWDGYYLSLNPVDAVTAIAHRVHGLGSTLAMPVVLFAVLVVVGCLVLARLGRPVLALTLPVLYVEMIAVAVAKRYPFLDRRTSHFLLIASVAVAAIGVVGVLAELASRRPWVAAGVAVAASALFLFGAAPYVRDRSIPREDVRSQVDYVARHRRPHDVVVVGLPAQYGFSYYWPDGRVAYKLDRNVSMGFVVHVENLSRVVYVDGFTKEAVTAAMMRALVMARPGDRIWIVRSHLKPKETEQRISERASWDKAFAVFGLQPAAVEVGAEALLVVQRH